MATIVEALQPRAPRQGLLHVLPELPGAFPARESIEFAPELCAGFGGVEPVDCVTEGDLNQTDDGTNPGLVEDFAWWVWQSDTCSTAAMDTRNFQGRAERALLATQSFWLARALWTGSFNASGNGPRALASAEAEVVGEGADSVHQSLAALERALGECGKGRIGLIHMSSDVFSVLSDSTQLRLESGIYLTPMGHRVVADDGYTGSGPGGEEPGATQWMYATSDMARKLDAITTTPSTLREATDHRTNRVRVVAGRFALIQWDECCHFAAEVETPWVGAS